MICGRLDDPISCVAGEMSAETCQEAKVLRVGSRSTRRVLSGFGVGWDEV